MERQRVFWVVLSVSALVVVVLVAGVLVLRPRAAGTVSPISGTGASLYEYQAEPSTTGAPAASGAAQPGGQAGTGAAQPGGEQTMHFYIGEESGGQQEAQQGAQPGGQTQSAEPARQAPAAEQPAASPAEQPSGKQAVASRPAPKKPARALPAKKVTEYWIQTGAYKSQTKAEELAAQLGGKGLNGRVFSFAAKTDTYYRVRVGPYTNKAEAEKFLAEVRKLQGLEASFISQVQSTRPAVN
jgi:cell division protein FtsN